MLAAAVFSGCSFYDNVGKPVYIGIKSGVKHSNINPKTKARLKKIDDKAVAYDSVRTTVKKHVDVKLK